MPGPKSGVPLDVEVCQRVFATYYRRIRIDGDCWTWTGALNHLGYGGMRVGRTWAKAHRVAWVARQGRDIPPGMTIDHLCRNRACVNPDHLEPVSAGENIKRSPITIISLQESRARQAGRATA